MLLIASFRKTCMDDSTSMDVVEMDTLSRRLRYTFERYADGKEAPKGKNTESWTFPPTYSQSDLISEFADFVDRTSEER